MVVFITSVISATAPNFYVLFTAYSIVSTYLSHEVCTTITGSPILIPTDVSITKPPNADPTAFQSSAIAKFLHYLGFTTCAPGVHVVVNIPTDTTIPTNETLPPLTSVTSPSNASSTFVDPSVTLPLATSSTFPNATIPPSPTVERLSSGISTSTKVAVGAVIPAVGLASLSLLATYVWRKRQRSQATKSKNASSNIPEIAQPYLQQKAELDSEGKRQHELDAQELRYEMDGAETRFEAEGDNASKEMSTERRRREQLSLSLTHELRGEEHAKELEGPEIL